MEGEVYFQVSLLGLQQMQQLKIFFKLAKILLQPKIIKQNLLGFVMTLQT